MPGLILRRLRSHGADRGAVAVLVAILFGGGVLLGMGALVVDIGGMYAEKAQLQNGADGGALAVATGCAQGSAACAASVTALNSNCSTATNASTGIASCNANDNKTAIDQVCGVGSGLTACTGPQNGCPAAPSGNYAQVQTSTLNADGTTVLPPAFGKAVMGSSWVGEHVQACAQASWGPPSELGSAVAVTISECEWLENTNNGTTFVHSAPYPPWPPDYLDTLPARNAAGLNSPPITYSPAGTAAIAGSETVLTTHGMNNPCAAGHPGWDAPGKFGWLNKNACTVSITGNEYPPISGNAAAPCESVLTTSRNTGTPIFIPVYSQIDPLTGNYELAGFAAFVVTGWDVTSGNAGSFSVKKAPSLVAAYEGVKTKDQNYCGNYTASPSDVCLYGFFTQALIPASQLPGGSGGPSLGATSVKLAG